MKPPPNIPEALWDGLSAESRALVLLLSERQDALRDRVAALERSRRPRITLLTLIALVASAAIILGWAAVERRSRLGPLRAELERAEARAAWSEAMYRKKFVSKAQLASDRIALEKARSRADRLWPPPVD